MPAASCTACGRSSTTRSTRPSRGTGRPSTCVLHADNSVEVRDRARGIPVDIEPKTGLTGVEVVFTKLHAGGKFGSGSYAASGGLHGVGASVVNALSERLDVEVDRDGKTYAMSFHRGEPGTFADADPANPTPDAAFSPFLSGSELRIVGKVAQGCHRHAHPVLGRPADLHARRRFPDRGADVAGAPDRVPGARASPSKSKTVAAPSRSRRPSTSRAASRSSSNSSPRTLR